MRSLIVVASADLLLLDCLVAACFGRPFPGATAASLEAVDRRVTSWSGRSRSVAPPTTMDLKGSGRDAGRDSRGGVIPGGDHNRRFRSRIHLSCIPQFAHSQRSRYVLRFIGLHCSNCSRWPCWQVGMATTARAEGCATSRARRRAEGSGTGRGTLDQVMSTTMTKTLRRGGSTAAGDLDLPTKHSLRKLTTV